MTKSIKAYQRSLILTLLLLVVSLGYVWHLAWKYFNIRMEARNVWSMMADYETTRHSISKWGPKEDAAYLDIYARLNAKCDNLSLNLIMEHEKRAIIADIISDLRVKTGKDLGSDPEPWIKMFANQAAKSN